MDQRQTFEVLEKLYQILLKLRASNASVSFLLDRDGLMRLEGAITSIDYRNGLDEAIFALSDNEDCYYLRDVIAVNGIFRADYTEC